MLRQARAEQTRSSLIDAAAAQFARNGYTGATLARISQSAGVTSGALTFHFLTKEDLAHAVVTTGAAAARSALREVQQLTVPGLAAVSRLTQLLAAFLEQDVRAHAAMRLAYECPHACATWEEAWRPALVHALGLAQAGGATDTELADIELLVAYLLAGAEAQLRSGRPVRAVECDLGRLWQRAAAGLGARPGHGPVPCPHSRISTPPLPHRTPREKTGFGEG
ncbi:TetR family transcriptional regulator [Kitasatospora sp. NPDC056138]|uniref:TetR family transcriptional regulator n=1 Tax=Kitasatospora sp. NPDC056138 TaxID=3345724 RepID=UPI0035D681F1